MGVDARGGGDGGQPGDAVDLQPPQVAADVVGMIVGGERPDERVAFARDLRDQSVDVPRGVHQHGGARRVVGDEVHEIDHLGGGGIVLGEVAPGEPLFDPEHAPTVARESRCRPFSGSKTATAAPGRCSTTRPRPRGRGGAAPAGRPRRRRIRPGAPARRGGARHRGRRRRRRRDPVPGGRASSRRPWSATSIRSRPTSSPGSPPSNSIPSPDPESNDLEKALAWVADRFGADAEVVAGRRRRRRRRADGPRAGEPGADRPPAARPDLDGRRRGPPVRPAQRPRDGARPGGAAAVDPAVDRCTGSR